MLSPETAALAARHGAILHRGYPWWLRPFLLRDVIGITLGRHIFLDERYRGDADRLVRHELMHVLQAKRLGLPRFLYRYAKEWTAGMLRGRGAAAAYEALSFEVEARQAETDVSRFEPRGAADEVRTTRTIMTGQENPPPGGEGPIE
jgi:hypothetical protein